MEDIESPITSIVLPEETLEVEGERMDDVEIQTGDVQVETAAMFSQSSGLPDDQDGMEELLHGVGYNPPARFSFFLSDDEWNSINPEIVPTPVRKDGSRVLGPEWTNIFISYIAQKNTECVLIATHGRCRRADSKKKSSPWFSGTLVCKIPGCSVTYNVYIRPIPTYSELVVVDVEGQGEFNHSSNGGRQPIVPVPNRDKPKTRNRSLTFVERKRLEEQRMLRRFAVCRNKLERAKNYGYGSQSKMKKGPRGPLGRPRHRGWNVRPGEIERANAVDEDEGFLYEDQVEFLLPNEKESPLSMRVRTDPTDSTLHGSYKPVALKNSDHQPPKWGTNNSGPCMSANPRWAANELELQELKLRYYRMKIYKMERELLGSNPDLDLSVFEAKGRGEDEPNNRTAGQPDEGNG